MFRFLSFCLSIKIISYFLWDLSIFHKLCLSQFEKSMFPKELSCLICGNKFPQNSHFQLLQKLSIVHLVVISGFHIQILTGVIPNNILRPIFNYFFPLYCVITNFQIPVLRSCFVKSAQLNFTSIFKNSVGYQILISFVFLLIFPKFHNSVSFYLSHIASICFSIQGKNTTFKLFLCYICLLLLLIPIGLASPFVLLLQFIIAPLILTILFSLSLLFLIFKFSWIDSVWLFLFTKINNLSYSLCIYQYPLKLNQISYLLYFIIINSILWVYDVNQRRKFYYFYT